MLPPFFVVVVVAVLIIVLITTAAQHKRHSPTDQRLCAGCGTGHPAHAQFCRRCGRKL
jgi:ribosomal protein L40E